MRSLILLFAISASLAVQGPASSPAADNFFSAANGKTILVISPHPDDDIIGCGGALAYLAGRQNRVIAVYLTSGEMGTYDASLTPDRLRAIRKQEAAAAYQALNLPGVEQIWLGYPDSQLDFAPLPEIRKQLTGIIRKSRPDIVFALDPGFTYVRYQYHDHRSAALLSADAINAAEFPLEYPELGPAFIVPNVFYFYTAEPNFHLDVSGVYETKLSALAANRSQFPPALYHYVADGPAPSRAALERTISVLTGSNKVEPYRRVTRNPPKSN
ncbi:MAG TPA: PIG-L deacetylase family protein [Candidatus Acidoferrales bacterium]|nr:PIG-L deacetylase family protein [Candidatus Acidoferrales bacterium]